MASWAEACHIAIIAIKPLNINRFMLKRDASTALNEEESGTYSLQYVVEDVTNS